MTGFKEGHIIPLQHAGRASDPPSPACPAHPFFFGSGVLVVDGGGRRTVEYCLLDTFATIALKFRADWELNWIGRRARWQPTPQALAGLLMLRMALAGETLVIASREAEDHRLPVCAVEEADRVLSAEALYDDPGLRARAPAAAVRMACAHREALECEHTAYLVAARLHEIWTIADAARRAPVAPRALAEILPFRAEIGAGGPAEATEPRFGGLFDRLRPHTRPSNEGPVR